MTVTQVVDDALREYVLPLEFDPPPGLKREGQMLVPTGGSLMTLEDVDAGTDAARNCDIVDDEG